MNKKIVFIIIVLLLAAIGFGMYHITKENAKIDKTMCELVQKTDLTKEEESSLHRWYNRTDFKYDFIDPVSGRFEELYKKRFTK